MANDENTLTGARATMMYDANRKSTGVAYLLCLFFGGLGAHRFYLGETGTGAAQLVLWVLGWVTFFVAWIPLYIWIVVDLFLIPGLASTYNMKLADRFAS